MNGYGSQCRANAIRLTPIQATTATVCTMMNRQEPKTPVTWSASRSPPVRRSKRRRLAGCRWSVTLTRVARASACVVARTGSPAQAAPAAAAHQVHGAEQDGGAGQGGDPGGEVEEALEAVDVEELCGEPPAEQRPGDADQARDDDAV